MNTSMKLAVAVVTILLGISLTTTAQAKTKQPTQEVTTQTATTDDGRKAILKSNGTWEYKKEDSLSTKAKSTLSFDTGIVFRTGDIKPVARTKFYLLDKDLVSILSGFSHRHPQTGITEVVTSLMGIYISYCSSENSNEWPDRNMRVWERLTPHVVQKVTTDFSGKATFKQIPPGKYYLIGCTSMMRSTIVWNLEVDLSSGNNDLTLDQNNASYTY